MKGLHNIRSNKKASRTAKRVGRGNASGKGTYSGRGMKGQRARSGGRSGIHARSMKAYLQRIPKARGFSSGRPGYAAVNIALLQSRFEDGAVVTPKSLRRLGIVNRGARIKVLGDGKLSKKLIISAHAFSTAAKKAIEGAGGTAKVITAQAGAPAGVRAEQKQ